MRWYFDYISPYAYLQSTKLQQFADQESVECVPVLFAGLLNHWENKGPAEIVPKREWTLKNVVWLAHREGIPLRMPSHHPFNPLPLLRLGIAAGNNIEVVQRLFRFVWVDGHVPQQQDAFNKLLDELKINAQELSSNTVKETLLQNGKTALQNNVFGVPTIDRDGELFWGYEATDMALAHIDKKSWPQAALSDALNLPEGPGRIAKGAAPPTSSEPRIPFKPIDLSEPADVVDAIRKRRGGELIELDRLLLYSTPLAAGWNHLLGNARTQFSVSHKLRELAMCTVAVINQAEYEFTHHAPIYIKAGGSEEKTAALREPDKAVVNNKLFDKDELATIALATQMTRDVRVTDKTFDNCRKLLSDEHLVELVATIAAYNMVSRFLVALNIQPS